MPSPSRTAKSIHRAKPVSRAGRSKRPHLNLYGPIVKAVRRRKISRIGLAEELSIAASTAGIHVDQLIASGYMTETSMEDVVRRSGRRPRHLALCGDAGYFVGVDFEASSVMTSCLDFCGQVLLQRHESLPVAAGRAETMRALRRAITRSLPANGAALLGIGIGAPGPVDGVAGISLDYSMIKGWHHVPIASLLSKDFECPVFVENNARVAALAHHLVGQAKHGANFLSVTARSGIGIGHYQEGQLVRGAHSLSGEIGRLPVQGAVHRTLESVASPAAMLDQVIASGVKLEGDHSGSAEVFDRFAALAAAYHLSNRKVCRIVDDGLRALAHCLGQLVVILDPALILVDGPLTLLGEPARQILQEGLGERVPAWNQWPEVEFSHLGRYAGALGAAALVTERWEPVLRKN